MMEFEKTKPEPLELWQQYLQLPEYSAKVIELSIISKDKPGYFHYQN